MKLISFYCDVDGSNYYSDSAKKLRDKCNILGVENLILMENFGTNWIDNVKAKPVFLKKMLNELDSDFIWLDVDCDIHKKIDFDLKSIEWMVDFRDSKTPHDYVHVVKNCENNKLFLDRWIQEVSDKNKGSHSAFINIYKSLNYNIIPKNYVSINNLSNVGSKQKYFNNGKI
jgi:hypothetical protein